MHSFLTKLVAGLTAVSLGSIASGCQVPGQTKPEVVKLKPAPAVSRVVRPAVVARPAPSRPAPSRPVRPTTPY
jgi:hypothetical protein